MQTFKHFLLTESDTTQATNAEMAICYQYNMLKTNNDMEKSLSLAKISDSDFKKLTPELLKIGMNVAKSMGNRGDYLTHAGRANAKKNYYEKGSDVTPKADFFGNTNNYISLKKSGKGGGKGAQLMSAKSGEASGVFNAAVQHLSKNSNQSLNRNPHFIKCLDILENQMKDTARNNLNIEVSKGKKDFEFWYVTQSSRYQELIKKYPSAKVKQHLKAELSVVGATRISKSANSKLIPNVAPLSKPDFDLAYNEFINTDDVKIGNVLVSPKYLEKVSPKDLETSALKKQIVDVIETSIKSKAWQEELQKFFTNNEELKKWMVFEAASGLYKFTGKISDNTDYTGNNPSVANKILVFDDKGIKNEYSIIKYSEDNTNLVNNIAVAYKGSGRSKFMSLRIFSHFEEQLPLLTEEINNLKKQYYLSEGIFSNIKNKVLTFAKKIKDIFLNFVFTIISRFINNIKSVSSNLGVFTFLSNLGLNTVGQVAMNIPVW